MDGKAVLRIVGYGLETAAVTAGLNLQPSRLTKRSMKKGPMIGWFLESPAGKSATLEAQIEALVDIAGDKANLLHDLRGQGFTVEISCSAVGGDDVNADRLFLKPELLSSLASLGIMLAIHYYYVGDE